MQPIAIRVLERCIDAGIERGIEKSYKHNDFPDDETKARTIEQCIWEELYEWFDFNGGKNV
jgi:hypothetical protein